MSISRFDDLSALSAVYESNHSHPSIVIERNVKDATRQSTLDSSEEAAGSELTALDCFAALAMTKNA